MKYPIDLHTHTIVSGHAYNTIREMAGMAEQKGIKVLGISEHGPAMPGSCNEIYFFNRNVIPRELYGIRILIGAEFNIINYEGGIDLHERALNQLDYGIASLHVPCIKPGTMEQNTNAVIGAIKNPYVNILGHPDDARYEIDYEKMVIAAKENNVLIELNSASFAPDGIRTDCRKQDLVFLEYCKKYKAPVIMNSDAHFDLKIGLFERQIELLQRIDFPFELVMNDKPEILKNYLNKPECLDGILL